MDDFEKNKSAEPNGFDNTNSGYTVTPEGGFYNKQKNEQNYLFISYQML